MQLSIQQLAAHLNKASYLYTTDEVLGAAHSRLTGTEYKVKYARRLLQAEQATFAIPDSALDDLALKLAHPESRDEVVRSLHEYGYANPAIEWAGTSCTVVMERMFADLANGSTVVVAIPAQWSRDLVGRDREFTDEGLEFHYWSYGEIPSLPADSSEEPQVFALLSDQMGGLLSWGGYALHIYDGTVSLELEPQADALGQLLRTTV